MAFLREHAVKSVGPIFVQYTFVTHASAFVPVWKSDVVSVGYLVNYTVFLNLMKGTGTWILEAARTWKVLIYFLSLNCIADILRSL